MAVWLEKREPKKWLVRVQWKDKRRSKTFTGTKREALSLGRKMESELKTACNSEAFSNFAKSWNESRLASRAISKSTFEQYSYLFNGLSLHIGSKLMSDIKPEDLERALTALSNGDTPSSREWSGTTLRAAYKAANKLFSEALQRGIAAKNPASSVSSPKSDTKPKKALNLEESTRLLSVFENEGTHGFACSLMLRTGMRAGECLSAKWEDVSENGIRIGMDSTKTKAGVRLIPIDKDTRRMIEERREYVSDFLGRFGHEIEKDTKLCCTEDGRPLTYDALKHWWKRNQARFGLQGFTIHELRHTFATNLAQAGIHPAIMAALLGHSSSEITMEIYTHVQNADSVRAIERLSEYRMR